MDLTIIIPVRNEELVIRETLLNLENKLKIGHNVIVVDDYSTDNSHKIVEQISADHKNISLVFNAGQQGFASSLITGFKKAPKDSVVLTFMADSSDRIEDIGLMYDKVLEGYDIVCGSRYIKGGARIGGPFIKSFCSRLLRWLLGFMTKIPVTDLTNSFRMYRRGVLENINIESKGFNISLEIVLKGYRAGYKITEIPTVWVERKSGKSNFYIWKDWEDLRKFTRWFLCSIFHKKQC